MTTSIQDKSTQKSFAVVDGSQRTANHKVLQPTLFDLIALSHILKQLHWNVVGPNFRPLHLHLDEIYEVADEGVDAVAERLTATGTSPSGRLEDIVAGTALSDPPAGFLHDVEVLDLAEESLRKTIEFVRKRMAGIEEVDTVTADLLHQIVMDLEKHHWMIEAQRI